MKKFLALVMFLGVVGVANGGTSTIFSLSSTTTSQGSSALDLHGQAPKDYSALVVVTNETGSAAVLASASDINATTNAYTKTAHGLVNGTVGQWTTSSALPTGLVTSTDYWVVGATANTFQVSATKGGAAVDISDVGTGNQTFTPTALSATVKQQVSNDGTNWADVTSSSQNVTATGNLAFVRTPEPFDYARLYLTVTAGALDVSAIASTKQYVGQ